MNWLLWSERSATAVIIIPEEAEALLPIMRDTTIEKGTHLLVYSAPTTRKMVSFDELTYYSIPALPKNWKVPDWLRVELGIFSGRLYFKWDEYSGICNTLGVEEGLEGVNELNEEHEMDPDADDDDEQKLVLDKPRKESTGIASKPLTFMQEWLALRRRGQDFAHSPMGFLTQGKALQEAHPFFRPDEDKPSFEGAGASVLAPVPGNSQEERDDYDDIHGIDDMGANDAGNGDGQDEVKVEYNELDYCGGAAY